MNCPGVILHIYAVGAVVCLSTGGFVYGAILIFCAIYIALREDR